MRSIAACLAAPAAAAGVCAATAVAVDGAATATAVVIDDGSAIGAAVKGNNGAAFGPMHVMHCMCTGRPYGPYLASDQSTRHGLWKHMWTLRLWPGP